MVPLGDRDLLESLREVPEEHVDVPSLARGHLRDEVLHVPEDVEAVRARPVREVKEDPSHDLRAARDSDTLLSQLLLEADVEVRDDEGVPGEEGRMVRDGLDVHVRTNGSRALAFVRACGRRRDEATAPRASGTAEGLPRKMSHELPSSGVLTRP